MCSDMVVTELSFAIVNLLPGGESGFHSQLIDSCFSGGGCLLFRYFLPIVIATVRRLGDVYSPCATFCLRFGWGEFRENTYSTCGYRGKSNMKMYIWGQGKGKAYVFL